MKQVNIYFEDDDFSKFKELKGKMGWREFFLQLIDLLEEKQEVGSDV